MATAFQWQPQPNRPFIWISDHAHCQRAIRLIDGNRWNIRKSRQTESLQGIPRLMLAYQYKSSMGACQQSVAFESGSTRSHNVRRLLQRGEDVFNLSVSISKQS